MKIDNAPAGNPPLAPNPMLLVFLDLSIEEIDILCGIGRSCEPARQSWNGGWFDCLRKSLKSTSLQKARTVGQSAI